MDNALACIVDLEFDDVEIAAVVIQGLYLQPGNRVTNGRDAATALGLFRRHVVIRGGQVGVPPPGFPTRQAQALEGLGRSDLVQQVPVDIDQG